MLAHYVTPLLSVEITRLAPHAPPLVVWRWRGRVVRVGECGRG